MERQAQKQWTKNVGMSESSQKSAEGWEGNGWG